MRPFRPCTASRRGGLLLELLLSIALFAGAASLCLAVTGTLFASIDRADRRQFAADLARSKMAELEAGLITLQDLRGEWSGAVGSRLRDDPDARDPRQPGWTIDVTTSATEFRGLSLVELTVGEVPAPGMEDDDADVVRFTLRQLLALREFDAEAYEADDLLEGLPEAAAPPQPEAPP